MLEGLQYEVALRHLQKEKRQTRTWYAAANSKLPKEPKSREKLQNLTHEEIYEIQVIEDQIARLQTTFLRNEAQRYLLPIPEFSTDPDGAWEQATTAVHYQLKPAAIAELRSAIRKEKKERRERWQSWAALTIGLIGALIGLFSAMKK